LGLLGQAATLPVACEVSRAETAGMDERDFVAFYERSARSLRAYLIHASGSGSLADDLLQESYLRFLRSGFASDDEQYRRNYLFRIATNLLRDHYRRRRLEVGDVAQLGSVPGHTGEIEQRRDVSRALAQLKGRDRQLLWLAYVEGSSHTEIAETMGLQTASIKSMLSRARHRMAAALRALGLAYDG
jgi:RNA polymerase sigma-70 factor (ECF subfamily)